MYEQQYLLSDCEKKTVFALHNPISWKYSSYDVHQTTNHPPNFRHFNYDA